MSLHKAVSMAPHYSNWVKEFATDGNIRTDAAICECCAATNSMTNPWLQVDLGALHRISTITIYGRTDSYGPDRKFHGINIVYFYLLKAYQLFYILKL